MMNQPGRLLIIDDNEMNRDMLARRLEKHGYIVHTAESARDVIHRVKLHGADVVLLDIEMPEVSGLDALKALRKSYSAAELPIIMVTVKNQSEDVAEALNLGANDYLTKPVDLQITLARIGVQLSNKRALKALKESEQRYALAACGSNDGLWDWDIVHNTIYFSPRWKGMLGYAEYEIGDKPEDWFRLIHDADRDRVKDEIAAHLKGLRAHFESEHRMLEKTGGFRWVLSRGLAVQDESGTILRMAGSQTDISERKVPDPLTGLPNRVLFSERLADLMKGRPRHGDLFAVIFLDVDNFKAINDQFGHLIGDQLLVAVAARLEKSLRSADTIARQGGDEFTILLNNLKDANDAAVTANRIKKELATPFLLSGREVFISASVGIALSSGGYELPQEMLRDADTALYRAKALGEGQYEIFEPEGHPAPLLLAQD